MNPPDTHDPATRDSAATDEYDYETALNLDPWEPGINGCLGCFRCKAGDHSSCHGCVCACGWRWQPEFYGADFESPCPDICRNHGVFAGGYPTTEATT